MQFEVIFMYLYDVGRSVDTNSLTKELHHQGTSLGARVPIVRRMDTPASLQLPSPLAVELGAHELDPRRPESGGFSSIKLRARIYDDGVITVEVRARLDIGLEELHTVRARSMNIEGESATIDSLALRHFSLLRTGISEHIEEDRFYSASDDSEDYHVFCLLDPVSDPAAFLHENRSYLAPFLLGENPAVDLHQSQVATTLRTPFSFTHTDIAIFDMDRAFVVAPPDSYEDLLLIIEHANYQLLELRTLDKLLDRLLDDAERDVRNLQRGKKGRKKRPLIPGRLSSKLAKLQPLRMDALFILENLENSSRIIGDYYLEQIYVHLCSIFNTKGWKSNVERRLEILQSIYSLAKTDANDRLLIILELLVVLMIAFEIFTLFVPIGH